MVQRAAPQWPRGHNDVPPESKLKVHKSDLDTIKKKGSGAEDLGKKKERKKLMEQASASRSLWTGRSLQSTTAHLHPDAARQIFCRASPMNLEEIWGFWEKRKPPFNSVTKTEEPLRTGGQSGHLDDGAFVALALTVRGPARQHWCTRSEEIKERGILFDSAADRPSGFTHMCVWVCVCVALQP